jgi:hypothetical protein
MQNVPPLDSRWLVPLVTVGLGGVIFVAELQDDDLASGLIWLVILGAVGALTAFGGRFEPVRQARGADEDERDLLHNRSAMAVAGTVLVIVLTGAVVYQLVRGEDVAPYAWPLAIGGASYAIALLALRWRA